MTGNLVDILEMEVMIIGDQGRKLHSIRNGHRYEHLWGSDEVASAQAIWDALSPEDLPRYAALSNHLWAPDQILNLAALAYLEKN